MYLHEDRETFKNIMEQVSSVNGRSFIVVEKDYYVSLILKLLSDKMPTCVFKGGTSLSKGFRVINRFSEDIDITFDEHIGESRRKKLKHVVLKGISEELGMPITNWNEIQSDRDYNAYHFSYLSVFGMEDDRLPQFVKLETALGSYSFPTQILEIGNYIGDYLNQIGKEDFAEKFLLNQFSMKLQTLERTYIDKIFALCDYYMQGMSKRYSRHLYDLYKLTPLIEINDDFKKLFHEVRRHRAEMKNCPSAKEGVALTSIMIEFCKNDFYYEDYKTITSYFAEDYVSYEDAVENIRNLAGSGFWK